MRQAELLAADGLDDGALQQLRDVEALISQTSSAGELPERCAEVRAALTRTVQERAALRTTWARRRNRALSVFDTARATRQIADRIREVRECLAKSQAQAASLKLAELERQINAHGRSSIFRIKFGDELAELKRQTRAFREDTHLSRRERMKEQRLVSRGMCPRCREERPSHLFLIKADGSTICRPCAEGRTCPNCGRPKSPDRGACSKCAGGSSGPHEILGGGFETNRRRH